MDIEGDLLIITAAEYAEVKWNKDTTYYTIFPPEREGRNSRRAGEAADFGGRGERFAAGPSFTESLQHSFLYLKE
jgi:hypothetical protein